MNTKHKNLQQAMLDLVNLRTLGSAALIIIALGFSIWAISNLWPLLVVAAVSLGAFYIYRKIRSGVTVGENVTVTREALKSYLEQIVREMDGAYHPVLSVNGIGDNLHVKINMEFPSDPSRASEFHANIIYLQGYLARRLYDDFRISGAKVEIEASTRVEESVYTRTF